MPLILKPVGFSKVKYEIRDDHFIGKITLKILYQLFITWGIPEDEITYVKFITKYQQIKDSDIVININKDENHIIIVFTTNSVIKEKLIEIFIKEGTQIIDEEPNNTVNNYDNSNKLENPNPEICTPITQVIKSDPIPVLTPEIIDTMNIKSVSLFEDPDFKNLISIYMRKPELFSTMAKYLQNGNVIEESFNSTKLSDISDDIKIKYQVLCNKINNLGVNYPDDIIMERLFKYSGHLNLTLRSLLCENAIKSFI